jgi:hypothetical protein
MKRRAALATFVSISVATLAGAGLTSSKDVFAAGPKATSAPLGASDSPTVPSVSSAIARFKCGLKTTGCNYGTGVGAVFEGFKWGMAHNDVTLVHNRTNGLFDQEYNAELVKMQPGREMIAKEHERDDRKRAIEASFIQFLNVPTGYDATSIKNEYTYRNKESIQSLAMKGTHRYYFFMGAPPGERLWKVYEEVKLAEDGPLGKSFNDAVASVGTALGVAGRVRAADPSQNVFATTVDWQDGTSHLRLVDRSRDKLIGVVLEERATLNALPQLRANKAEDPFALDPSIQQVTAATLSDPNSQGQSAADAGVAKKKK